jgi:hypothetical protein
MGGWSAARTCEIWSLNRRDGALYAPKGPLSNLFRIPCLHGGNQAKKILKLTYWNILKNKKILAIFLRFVYKTSFLSGI